MKSKQPNRLLLIIAISAIVSIANYFCYPIINKLLDETIDVPVANTTLRQNDLIDKSMISYKTINANELSNDVITSEDQIVGYYVKDDNTIYDGCFFNKNALTKNDQIDKTEEFYYGIEVDDCYDELISQNDCVSIFIKADDYQNLGRKKIGLLVENCIVKSKTKDQIIVALNNQQLDYCLRAKTIGELFIVVGKDVNTISDYFSIFDTMNFIDGCTTINQLE